MASSSWFIVFLVCSMVLLSQERTSCLALPHHRKIIYINQDSPSGESEASAQAGASASVGVGGPLLPPPKPVLGGAAYVSASAGAGTTGSQAGGEGTVVVHKPIAPFDSIFNIPISILGAVNQLLNNKQATGTLSVSKASTLGASSGGVLSNANSDSSSSSAVSTVTVNKNPNLYNDIFNIPVTALKSVNQLLNGR